MTISNATGAANLGQNQHSAFAAARGSNDGHEFARLFGTPTYTSRVGLSTDDASVSASNVAMNLTSLLRDDGKAGFSNTNHYRDVTVRARATDGSQFWDYVIRQRIVCGTTPRLGGSKTILTDTLAHFIGASDSVTLTGQATGARCPEWSVPTLAATPTAAGAIASGAAAINWLGYSGAAGAVYPRSTNIDQDAADDIDNLVVAHQGNPDTGAGSSIVYGRHIFGATGAGIPTGTVVATADVLPPVDVDVLVDSVPDVVVGIRGTADTVNWTVDVWISDLFHTGTV